MGKTALIFAGLDLCHLDIRTHARPNAFESFLASSASRLNPLFSLLVARSLEGAPEKQRQEGRTYRTNLALRTYSGHLTESVSPGRLYRLNPSIIPLEGMIGLDTPGLKALLSAQTPGKNGRQFLFSGPGRPARERRIRAFELLSEWEAHLKPAMKDAILPALFRDRLALSLAYTIAPARLAKAKRLLRRDDSRAAESEARELLEDSRRFLRALGDRLRGGENGYDTL